MNINQAMIGNRISSTCSTCNRKKSQFVKNEKQQQDGGNLFTDIAGTFGVLSQSYDKAQSKRKKQPKYTGSPIIDGVNSIFH